MYFDEEPILRQLLGSGNMPQGGPTPRAADTQMGCGGADNCLNNRSLASVYAPAQQWRELYDDETALKKGTLFKDLEFPFLGGDTND